MPAVAAVRTASRHVCLAAEGDDTVAAASALDEDARAVVEHAVRIAVGAREAS